MPATILLVGWHFFPRTGGVETIMLGQARELARRGYRVTVLTSALPGAPASEEKDGFTILRREFMNPAEPAAAHRLTQDAAAILDAVKPDLIHFHNGSYPAGAPDRAIGAKKILAITQEAQRRGRPIIEHAHNAQLRQPGKTTPLRQIEWDYLLCVSDFVKRAWDKLGHKAKKVTVVYNGIDAKRFSLAQPAPEAEALRQASESLLFFPARVISMTNGALSEQKNIKLLLEAGAQLKKRGVNNWRLIAILNTSVGAQTSGVGAFEELAADLGLGANLTLIEPVPYDQMPAYYAAIDIMAAPAINETFGLMFIEAMAAGKPVVASTVGGQIEYIENGVNGYLINPTDAVELADVLEKLLKDNLLRRQIGAAAERTAARFSYAAMVDKIESVYRELLT